MENEKEIKNANVETFATDMAEVIENDREGLVKKIIHEQEMREKEKADMSPDSTKNKTFMLISIALIFISVVVLVYFLTAPKVKTVEVEPEFKSLIFNDKSVFLDVDDLSKDQIVNKIVNEIKGSLLKNGEVEGIYFTESKKIIGLREFLNLIYSKVAMPDIDFVSDNFMAGYVEGESKDPFILIKARSLSDVFPTMTGWEEKMFYDLHSFFNVTINKDNNYLFNKSFEDGVVYNKNARILYDNDGKIVFMYVYADDSSVLITSTANAATEVVNRLLSSKIKK